MVSKSFFIVSQILTVEPVEGDLAAGASVVGLAREDNCTLGLFFAAKVTAVATVTAATAADRTYF